ncbi:galactokinase [Spirosoma luteolum]
MNNLVNQLQRHYKCTFQQSPLLVGSPGRINLLGEHTDYNGGFALPAAIDKAIYLAVGLRQDKRICLEACDLQETFTGSIDAIQKTSSWADYLLGVASQFQEAGLLTTGFNCIFGGTIPVGAGLSSSAALENGVGFSLNELLQTGLDRPSLARLSQQAENQFVGAQVGIMDMFASLMGKTDHILKLDCRSLDYTYVPFSAAGVEVVLLNSQVKHTLVSSAYNARRLECETGLKRLQFVFPWVHSLRDATVAMLDDVFPPNQQLLYNRCSYVIEENSRVLTGVDFLRTGEFNAFGHLMYQTHLGLKDKFDVSCAELDLLVDLASKQPGVIGSRMMGGGFGGCTLNLVQTDCLPAFIDRVCQQYRRLTNKASIAHVCKIQSGTHLIER